jgi:hypothetical protein
MDRLGHQQQLRRRAAARPSSRSIARMVDPRVSAGAGTVATTTE